MSEYKNDGGTIESTGTLRDDNVEQQPTKRKTRKTPSVSVRANASESTNNPTLKESVASAGASVLSEETSAQAAAIPSESGQKRAQEKVSPTSSKQTASRSQSRPQSASKAEKIALSESSSDTPIVPSRIQSAKETLVATTGAPRLKRAVKTKPSTEAKETIEDKTSVLQARDAVGEIATSRSQTESLAESREGVAVSATEQVDPQAEREQPSVKELKAERRARRKREKAAEKARKASYGQEFVHVEADPQTGLSEEQVVERRDRGMTNEQPNVVTKSYFRIFRSNVLTLFNLINFFLATLILMFGELKNALFIVIATGNMIVGIVQEIRSKLTLEKMSLLSAPSVETVRGGKVERIAMDDIVIDDIIIVKQGEQIPADSVVVDGQCEVNESLLTGEQDDVHKEPGSQLLSGSFVQAGSVRARVQAVGKDNFTSKLLVEAKQFKKPKSELMRSINWIIRIVSIIIFPLGLLMFFTNRATAPTINQAVTGTVASIVGMIPEGLVMLTSVALAVGIVKLARKRTLVQDLYCIETLARVDVLCLDKTGTITEGSMEVEQTKVYTNRYGSVTEIMGNMVAQLGNEGATFAAFAEYFKDENLPAYEAVKKVPFSSARKWSGVDFGKRGSFIVGAPEFVLHAKLPMIQDDVNKYSSQGFRVLVLVKYAQSLSETLDENKITPVALIVLSDKIRENAKATFEYFAKQGVTLKVISGDNPITVSKVAERAGLAGADRYIDAAELDTPEKIYEACDRYTIFGRVTPKQKKLLVSSLKSKGYTVGMTGDGVNDVMALKEADCSIAMASGSEASRNVAQLVLLDSDFSALPSVVAEGRRVINNIERAASLFLVKTTFSIALTLMIIISANLFNLPLAYPFEPIQLSLIGGLFVGIPSFFLALEPNDTKVSGSFLGKVFKKALPAGLTVALLLWIVSYTYSDIGISSGDVTQSVSTMCFFITSVVSFVVLLQVCMPFNKERLFLVALCAVCYVALATADWAKEILSIANLNNEMALRTVILCVCSLPIILVMRAEVEAFKALFNDGKTFVLNVDGKIKDFKRKRKEKNQSK